MLNRVMLIGRLGHNPDRKTIPDGTLVANFSLATQRSWRDELGEKHTETEWREDARSIIIKLDFLLENIHQSPGNKISVSLLHLGKMKRRSSFQTMLDVIDDILRCEDHIRTNITQRQMQHRRRMLQ